MRRSRTCEGVATTLLVATTALVTLFAWLVANRATAQESHVPRDRVVVLRAAAEGSAADHREALEDALAEGVQKAGKLAVYEQVPGQQEAPPHPDTEAEARTIAEIHGTKFLVAGRLQPLEQERLRIELRVENVAQERFDHVRFDVYPSRLSDAVIAVLPLALRENGLGTDGLALTKSISAGEGVWTQSGQGQAVAEPGAGQSSAEQDPGQAGEQANQEEQSGAQPQTSPSDVSALATTGPLSIGAGVALRPLVTSAGSGGVLVGPIAQGRYRLFDGFSVHANFGLMWGAASALELSAGAAYLPLALESVNLRIGASLEVGAYFSFSGSRDPALLLRASPVLFLALTENVGVDVGLLEFGWLSGADAITLGGHARLRYSF